MNFVRGIKIVMYGDVLLLLLSAILQIMKGEWHLLLGDSIIVVLVAILGNFLQSYAPKKSGGFLLKAIFTFDIGDVPSSRDYIEFILFSFVSVIIFYQSFLSFIR